MAQNDKNYVLLTPYLRNWTSYYCDFWYMCAKLWYLQHFFSCFQNSDFSGFSNLSINAKRRFWGVPSHIHVVFYIYLRFFCILIVIILWIIARKYDLGELYFILLWNESVYFCALLKMNRWFLSEMKNKELRNEEEYIQQQQNGVDGDPRK